MNLRVLLGGIVGAVATSACGGKVIDDSNAGPPPECTSGGTSLGTLSTTSPVDYVELRYDDSPGATVVRSSGTKCKTASNQAACQSAFDALTASTGFKHTFDGPSIRGVNYYLAFTAGDKVGTVTTLAELLAFLGPIDTPDEAVLMATLTQPNTSADYSFDCSNTLVRTTPGGFDVITTESWCGTSKVEFHVTTAGDVTKVGEEINPGSNCPIARRTAGIGDVRARSRHPVGAFFERATYFEAMSVPAFARLGRELRAHGAPRRLVRGARSAACDESVHAKLASLVARRYGGGIPRCDAVSMPTRSLEAMALENAVEGCIRETHGALVATWQARAARDPVVRAVMARIARDEARHASLARRVAAWAEPKLAVRARERIAAARKDAIESVRNECARAPHAALVEEAGMPDARTALALIDAATPALFSPV